MTHEGAQYDTVLSNMFIVLKTIILCVTRADRDIALFTIIS